MSEPHQLEKWRGRAEFIESEARSSVDRTVKARGLLVASEIFALAGDDLHSHELAIEARDLSPMHPLLHRQARALSVREGDFEAVAVALQGEGRSAATPAARVHGAMFSAEIARVALGDEDLAQKRLEQAIRAAPADVRGYINRIGSAIGESQPLPKIRWPDAGELAPLIEAASTLARWRGSSDRTIVFANPVDALMRARATVRARDAEGAIERSECPRRDGRAGGGRWLADGGGRARPWRKRRCHRATSRSTRARWPCAGGTARHGRARSRERTKRRSDRHAG